MTIEEIDENRFKADCLHFLFSLCMQIKNDFHCRTKLLPN